MKHKCNANIFMQSVLFIFTTAILLITENYQKHNYCKSKHNNGFLA